MKEEEKKKQIKKHQISKCKRGGRERRKTSNIRTE